VEAMGGLTQLSHRSAVSDVTMPDPSIWPFPPFRHTPPVVTTHPPRQPSGSRSRAQSVDQPQDLLEPVPSAPRRTTLAPIFTRPLPQVGPRPFRDRLGQRQVADQGLRIRASIDGHAEKWCAGVLSGTRCPARPIPGIARRNSNVRRWAGPLL
jgi:hypothetical protein